MKDKKHKNPFILVTCAQVLITLPTIVNGLSLAKLLLIKSIQIAPNDLSVLKTVAKVIVIMRKKVIFLNLITITVIIYIY